MVKKEMELEEPIKFYNGTETLQFDRANWTWYRHVDGGLAPLAGVTSVLHVIDKSLYLVPWAAKMGYLALLRTMPRTEDAEGHVFTDSIPWGDFDALAQKAKGAHKEKLEDAGDVGGLAHKWIENSIKHAIQHNDGIVDDLDVMAPTDERAVNCGLGALDWMKKHNVRFLTTERPIYSRKYGYAGTADGTALVDSCDDPKCCPSIFQDELSLIDWKSSNQLSVDYLLQTAAYLFALHEEDSTLRIESRWILRLSKDAEKGKLFEAWYEREWEQDFQCYLAAKDLQGQFKAVTKRMADASKLKTFNKRAEKKLTKEEEKERKAKMRLAKRTASVV